MVLTIFPESQLDSKASPVSATENLPLNPEPQTLDPAP